jgi:hypothetical protein
VACAASRCATRWQTCSSIVRRSQTASPARAGPHGRPDPAVLDHAVSYRAKGARREFWRIPWSPDALFARVGGAYAEVIALDPGICVRDIRRPQGRLQAFFQPLGPVPARRQERDGLLARIPAGDQRSHRRIVRCVGSLGGTLTGGPMGGLLVRAVRASSAGRPIWTAVITRAAVAMPTCRLVTGRDSGGRTGRRFGWVQS